MQCSEVSRRLDNSEKLNDELIAHLKVCESCRRQAEAQEIIDGAFLAERDSLVSATAFSDLRSRVALRAAKKEKAVMAGMKNIFSSYPKISLSAVAVICLIAFIVLVPLPYNRTVGYNLAASNLPTSFSDLAFSEGLKALGYEAVNININATREGLRLQVGNLPSRQAAKEVEVLISNLGNEDLIIEVTPIIQNFTGSLYAQARQKLVEINIDGSGKTDEQIKAEIKAKLAEQGIHDGIIYVKTDPDSTKHIELQLKIEENGPDSGRHLMNDIEITSSGKTDAEIEAEIKARLAVEGRPDAKVSVVTGPDGKRQIEIEQIDTTGGK